MQNYSDAIQNPPNVTCRNAIVKSIFGNATCRSRNVMPFYAIVTYSKQIVTRRNRDVMPGNRNAITYKGSVQKTVESSPAKGTK